MDAISNRPDSDDPDFDAEIERMLAQSHLSQSEYEPPEDVDDDKVSVATYNTMNRNKYYIAPDADLDEVMERLLNHKSKKQLLWEQQQQHEFDKLRQNQSMSSSEAEEPDKEFEALLSKQQPLAVEVKPVQMADFVFADEVLLAKIKAEEASQERPMTAQSVKPQKALTPVKPV